MGAVIGGEHDEGVFGELEFFQEIKNAADIGIHERDHGGESFFGFGPVPVLVDSPIRDFLSVALGASCFVVGVGDGPIQVEVKRLVFATLNEGEGFFGDAGVSVGDFLGRDVFLAAVDVTGESFFLVIPPEVFGVEIVGFALVNPTVEEVDALFVGVSGFAFAS